jgi:WD40 repeat protein
MPDPITILMAVAYAIVKNAGTNPNAPSAVMDAFAQLFGGAAGNAFHGDVQGLKRAFLNVSRPDSNQDLERAIVRAALHADLFCLMKSLSESIDPPAGQFEKWWLCVEERLPQALRDLQRVAGGVLSEGNRSQLLLAKADCINQLKQTEINFVPSQIKPHQMLAAMEEGYAEKCAVGAFAALESKHGKLPLEVRRIFVDNWFEYLCGSFHHEIKQNQPVANILLNISVAELDRKIDQGFGMVDREFRETQELIRQTSKSPYKLFDTFATVPPLPPSFIPRPEIIEPIIASLSDSRVVALTAIEGLGGIGKTVVANEICHDARVRSSFPDGILWFPIGRQSGLTPEGLTRQIAEHMNVEFKVYSQAAYRSLFINKSILVVLDDVWTLDLIQPFRLESGGSRLLYTTRNREIASSLGAKNYDISLLDDAQARLCLGRWSGREGLPLPEPQATEILRECRGLVLAVAMIGAALKGKRESDWERILLNLRKANLNGAGTRIADYVYPTLSASIAASVGELSPEDTERYFRLAILLEDMAAPAVLLQQIWGDELGDVETAMNRLVDLSLASRDAGGGIRIHDLQHDYVQAQFSDREALDLIHGAIRLSAHVITKNPGQFSSQTTGRLLAYRDRRAIADFLSRTAKNTSIIWLRPYRVALHPPGTALIRTLVGHSDSVSDVAMSADGRIAVSASWDNTLKVWDLESGSELHTLFGHSDRVVGVGVSADGRTAVSGSWDKTLKVWDLTTAKEVRTLAGHANRVTKLIVSANGRRAFSIADFDSPKLWDVESGSELPRPEGIRSVAMSADGYCAIFHRFVGGYNADMSPTFDHSLEVWDLERGRKLFTLIDKVYNVYAMAVSADGHSTICDASAPSPIASVDGHIDYRDAGGLKVWRLETGTELRTLAKSGQASSIAISENGQCAVSSNQQPVIKVWDIEADDEPRELLGHSGPVNGVAIGAAGRLAVSASDDKTLKVWDLTASSKLQGSTNDSCRIRNVAVSVDGRTGVSVSENDALKVWNLATGSEVEFGASSEVGGIAVSEAGRLIASNSVDATLRVRDLKNGKEMRTIWTSSINDVAVSADGRLALDKKLQVWDLEIGKVLHKLTGFGPFVEVNCIAISADGRLGVAGFWNNRVKMWNLESGARLHELVGHTDSVRCVAISETGRQVISASCDQTLKVWDTARGSNLYTLTCGSISGLALSPNGLFAISASQDANVTVWDLRKRKNVASFTSDFPMTCCAISNDYTIMAGDSGGYVHLFSLQMGEEETE